MGFASTYIRFLYSMTSNAARVIECAMLSGAPSIPVIAGVALGIQALPGEFPSLAALLRSDPVFVLRLLRASDAIDCPASTGVVRRIDSVIDIGGQALIQAALLDAYQRATGTSQPSAGYCRYWAHSLLTAEIARELSSRCGGSDPDEAYLAGLLHDVALPLLAPVSQYTALLSEGMGEHRFSQRETADFGISHAEVGADLLPEACAGDLADALRFHHADTTLFGDAPELLRVVRAAEELAGGGMGDAIQRAALAHALTGLPMEALNDAWQAARSRANSLLGALQLVEAQAPVGDLYCPQFEPAVPPEHDAPSLAGLVRTGLFAQMLEPGTGKDIWRSYRLAASLLLDLPMPTVLLPVQGQNGFALMEASGEPGPSQIDLSQPGLDGIRQQLAQGLPWYCESAGQTSVLPVSFQRLLRPARDQACIMLPVLCDGGLEALALHRVPAIAVAGLRPRIQELTGLTAATARALRAQRAHDRDLGELRRSMVDQYAAHSKQLRADLHTPLGLLRHQVKSMRLKTGADSLFDSELSVFSDQIARIDTVLHQFEARPPDISSVAQWTDINQLMEQIVSEVGERTLQPRSITTELRLDPALPPLHLPLAVVRDIVTSLLTAGAEQTGSGGRIVLSSADGLNWNGNQFAEIRIRDFGRGMDAARVAALFEPQPGEIGVRNALVQALAQARALGGVLSCKSAIGQGTVFQLLLPRQTRRRAQGTAKPQV